jgi:hypothetical protein
MNDCFDFSVVVQQNNGATHDVFFKFTDNSRWTHQQLQTAIEDRCGIRGTLSTRDDCLLWPGPQQVTRETAADLKFKVSVIVKFAHQQDDSTTGFALHHILPLLTPGKRHSKHT